MNKRKIVLLATSLCMIAILAIGGTLAYFTDTDEAVNVFTVGNVDITLIEQESNADHTGLVDYTGIKNLMPIVGSAQGEKYPNGQPKAANYIDKVVTIKNTGVSDAYVRAYFAIPAALDDGYDDFNAGLNVLHFNYGNKDSVTTYGKQWNWKQENGKWKYYETTIDGVKYNVYFADYYQPLKANETTEQFISGVYLDKSFDCKDGKYYAFDKEVNLSGLIKDGKLTVKCPVKAVAVQVEGFDSVDAAVTAAFGANFDPFEGTDVTNWQ